MAMLMVMVMVVVVVVVALCGHGRLVERSGSCKSRRRRTKVASQPASQATTKKQQQYYHSHAQVIQGSQANLPNNNNNNNIKTLELARGAKLDRLWLSQVIAIYCCCCCCLPVEKVAQAAESTWPVLTSSFFIPSIRILSFSYKQTIASFSFIASHTNKLASSLKIQN